MRFLGILFSIFLLMSPIIIAQSDDISISDSLMEQPSDSAFVTAGTDKPVADNFIYPMTEERRELLESYSGFNSVWRFVSIGLDLIILGLIIFTGFSSRIRAWAEKISKKRLVHWMIYIILFTLISFIIYFPIDYYRNFVVEHEYGFANQTFGEWLSDGLTMLVVQTIFMVLIISILYSLINKYKKWWLYFSLGMIPFAVIMIVIVPVFISPLTNEYTPLENKELAGELTAMAHRAGIENPDIYQVDGSKQSNKINAYFTGMFGTKRIVLYDTMLDNFSNEEILYVMGHEIGHYVKSHIWKGLFLAIGMIFITAFLADKLLPKIIDRYRHKIGFDSLKDIASFPLLLLFITVFGFITQPISNSMSRVYEYDCDEYGLHLSGVTDEVAVTAFDKLSVFNLSDPNPSDFTEFWFYDHPALNKRMANVKNKYNGK